MKKQLAREAKSDRAALCVEMDGYLVTSDVVQLTRYSKRTLVKLISEKKFPAPDVPGYNGSANRWRRSTIKRVLDGMESNAKPVAAASTKGVEK